MNHHLVLKKGQWTEASFPVSSFKAVSPLTAKQLPDSFPVSSFLDLDEMLQWQIEEQSAKESLTGAQLSQFLLDLCGELSRNREKLLETAHNETALEKSPFLDEIEFDQALSYLKSAAEIASKRNWVEARIDRENNIRSMRRPLNGPVVIFSPSAAPFLFSSCIGVNFAAAIAAGNSVIAKGNPLHPLTGLLLAQIVHKVLSDVGLPTSLFQYFHHTTPDLGFRLASHPMVGAVSYTGGFRSGIMLKENADRAGNPIYLDLATVNPILLLPQFISENRNKLAEIITQRALRNSGQNRSRPGPFFLVENVESSQMIHQICENFSHLTARPMLSEVKARRCDMLVASLLRLGARKLTKKEYYSPAPFLYPNTVLVVDLKTYLKYSRQFQEYFTGPVLLFVMLEKVEQFSSVASSIENCSCCSLFVGSSPGSIKNFPNLLAEIRRNSATILENRWPHRQTLSNATIRTGSFPASGNQGFSNYGLPEAIRKFTILQSFEGFTEELLPEVLHTKA